MGILGIVGAFAGLAAGVMILLAFAVGFGYISPIYGYGETDLLIASFVAVIVGVGLSLTDRAYQ